MSITSQIAKHFRDVHYGGNWTCSNLKDQLKDVTWQQATRRYRHCNTILTLTYHIHYYVLCQLRVLRGEPLTGKDEESFNHTPVNNETDWKALLQNVWAAADELAELLEKLPDEKLLQVFEDEKYGNYYRNIHGLIEHTHYHLGQIALLKKLISNQEYDTP